MKTLGKSLQKEIWGSLQQTNWGSVAEDHELTSVFHCPVAAAPEFGLEPQTPNNPFDIRYLSSDDPPIKRRFRAKKLTHPYLWADGKACIHVLWLVQSGLTNL